MGTTSMKTFRSIWTWIKNKFGRLTTGIGTTLMGLEAFDANPLKPWLADLFNEKIATRIVAGVAAFFFLLSYVRHQLVANKHPATDPLPPPPQSQATR